MPCLITIKKCGSDPKIWCKKWDRVSEWLGSLIPAILKNPREKKKRPSDGLKKSCRVRAMWWWAGDGDVISCDGDGKKRCRGRVIVMGEKKQKWNSK